MSAEKPQRRRRAESAPATTGARLIRKYGNRRLYDTHDSRYVTLGDLVDVFSGEEEVKVIDAVSGEDLTKRVLAQAILFEEGRRHTQIIPIHLLRVLLRHRGEPAQKIAKLIAEAGAVRGKHVEPEASDGGELDELKRRLKLLESQIKRK